MSQAGSRCWNRHFKEFLSELGFKTNEADPCLYTMRDKNGQMLFVCLYADDRLVAATVLQESEKKKNHKKSRFKI